MRLKSIEADDLPVVAGWLADPENYQWLHFSHGTQKLTVVGLRIMAQRDIHMLRLFSPDEAEDRPVGLVGLSDIDRTFRTATLWAVLGDKRFGRRGLTCRALRELLTIGFRELELAAVNAWTLEINQGGRRILDRLGFTLIGRQRQCHVIDGRRYDRLWYDLLAEEHDEH